ncbi:MAG: OadG family protein [Treponema sp.]|nr:OadG family protein [Treponema sp.]
MSLTLMEMINQGSVLHLIGMGIIFALMIILISALGKGIVKKFANENEAISPAAAKTGDGVIAAITAAVTEYRKTK